MSAKSDVDDAESEDGFIGENDNETGAEEDQEWCLVVGNFEEYPFEQAVRATDSVNRIKTENEVAYYKLFIDEGLVDTIVTQTNIYAEQTIVKGITEESLGPSSRLNKWYPTDRNEVYRFLGILMWMGLDQKPSLSDYWRKSDLYWSNAAKSMSRNRFEIIVRMLHFSIMSNAQETDYSKCSHLLTRSMKNLKTTLCVMKMYASMKPWSLFVDDSSSVNISKVRDISLE
nr:unnamed protein product [Callosobruchus analis]